MGQSKDGDPRDLPEDRLPRGDWFLLPFLSLLTIGVIVLSEYLIATWTLPRSYGSGEDCIVFNDRETGPRGLANSVCLEKLPEAELTEYRFNSCGHRTNLNCDIKPPGVYRVVMVGTSFAMGMRVPTEKTFAALLPLELSRRIGRPVELYNEGMVWRPPHVTATHFDVVLAAKPDMILWILATTDIWNRFHVPDAPPASDARNSTVIKARPILGFVKQQLKDFSSRCVFLLRHHLYRSQSQYISSSLMQNQDDPNGWRGHGPEFLKTRPSPEWQELMKQFDEDAAAILAQAKAAGIPLAVALLPERTQAAMISKDEWPAGFDPYKLNNEVRSIVERHGGTYVDVAPDFRNVPNAEQYYFPLDGHLDANGNAMITSILAKRLVNGPMAELRPASPVGR